MISRLFSATSLFVRRKWSSFMAKVGSPGTRVLAGAVGTLVGSPLAVWAWGKLFDDQASSRTPTNPGAPELWTVIWLLVGVVAAVAGVYLTWSGQQKNADLIQAAESRRSHTVTRFADELGGMLDVLLDFGRSDGTYEDSTRLVKDILREGRRLYAHNGVRVCVYELDEAFIQSGEEDGEITRAWFLKLRGYDGRRDSPRMQFVGDDSYGKSLIDIARSNRIVSVPNPATPPDDIKVDHSVHSGWKSYMAVPLIGDKGHVGVLTVDTREQLEFTDEDKSIGATIAKLVVEALRASADEAENLRPEASAAEDRMTSAKAKVSAILNRHGIHKVSDFDETLGDTDGDTGQEDEDDKHS